MEIGFEIEEWGDLDFDVKLIWDRVGNPAVAADGTQPKPNDARLFFGLGWEF